MNTQAITPDGIAPGVPAAHHGRLRIAAVAAGVAAVVAAGGYGVLQAVGPETATRQPISALAALDSARVQQLRDSLANQYRTAPATAAAPSVEQFRVIRDGLAAQYRTIVTAPATPPAEQLRQIRDGLAAQYRDR